MGVKGYVRQLKERPEFRFAFPVAEVAKRAGEVLREMRLASGKKQGDIAKELEISQPRMSQIESGKVEHLPPLALMAKYAEVCGDSICILPKKEYDALVKQANRRKARLRPFRRKAIQPKEMTRQYHQSAARTAQERAED